MLIPRPPGPTGRNTLRIHDCFEGIYDLGRHTVEKLVAGQLLHVPDADAELRPPVPDRLIVRHDHADQPGAWPDFRGIRRTALTTIHDGDDLPAFGRLC